MSRLLLFVIASAACAGLPIAEGRADTGGDPPVVTIYEFDGVEEFVDVEELAVVTDEDFILWAVAVGDTPFVYSWYIDGVPVATGSDPWRLDIAFADPGVFVIRCDVSDANNIHGDDSVVVTVSSGPVVNEPATWTAVKAVYR
jgi:hypothetical protein